VVQDIRTRMEGHVEMIKEIVGVIILIPFIIVALVLQPVFWIKERNK
jgi:hypothetical protein